MHGLLWLIALIKRSYRNFCTSRLECVVHLFPIIDSSKHSSSNRELLRTIDVYSQKPWSFRVLFYALNHICHLFCVATYFSQLSCFIKHVFTIHNLNSYPINCSATHKTTVILSLFTLWDVFLAHQIEREMNGDVKTTWRAYLTWQMVVRHTRTSVFRREQLSSTKFSPNPFSDNS